ncbi:hypothetical protein [Hwanghaeella sp. 1Z406]|uniref:hypothetical protein n=1 Tax=Hwanghaeella sp. 1Z406 TaxID=3402811 RepID=UPI003B685C42
MIISYQFALLGVKAHKIIKKHEYSFSDFILDCDANGLIILDTKKSKIFMIFVHRGNPICLKRSDYLYVDRETVNHYFRKKTYIYNIHYLDNGVKTIWQFPCHSSWREKKFSQLLSKTKERIYPYGAKTSACTELQKRIAGREPSILEKPGKGKHITPETLRPLEKAIIESIKEMNEAYLDMPTVQDVAWCIIPYCEKIEERRFAKRLSESLSNKVYIQFGIILRNELVRHNVSA